jgi:hypothetical protein
MKYNNRLLFIIYLTILAEAVGTLERNFETIFYGYGLDSPGVRVPVGVRFSAPVQTGPGAHAASCTMGTGSFPG